METNYLIHHGVKGQKWGVRRYQNPDGTLTSAGKKKQDIIDEAAKKADRFAKYSREDYETFSKGKTSDQKRWARVSQQGETYYKNKANTYKSYKVYQISKKQYKEAKNFVKKSFYTDPDYADYSYKGETHNYLNDKYKQK